MAGQPADVLPPELLRALDDERLDATDHSAYLLVTTDPGGEPRISMLSAGEVIACDEQSLRVALWQGTRTAANLARGGTALFGMVVPGRVVYVRTEPSRLLVPEAADLECFELTVTGVKSDMHAGMPVTSGITFRVEERDRAATVAAWQRQRELLTRAGRSKASGSSSGHGTRGQPAG